MLASLCGNWALTIRLPLAPMRRACYYAYTRSFQTCGKSRSPLLFDHGRLRINTSNW